MIVCSAGRSARIPKTSQSKNNMASAKKKSTAKTSVKFKDLKSRKDPKGGPIYIKSDAQMKYLKLD